MLPFELVATATDSPRFSPAGSLRKLGTEVKGISGTPVIVAFCWADAAPARSRTAAYVENRCRVMDGSLYQGPRPFNQDPATGLTCSPRGSAGRRDRRNSRVRAPPLRRAPWARCCRCPRGASTTLAPEPADRGTKGLLSRACRE